MLGQLDYTKEILIPRKNPQGADGYDVINPLYCYEGGKVSMKELFNDGDPVKIERSAIIINRGWIPANLRDKKTRPTEVNSRQLVKVRGVFRAGKDLHDYKVPNNPDNNEWHNLALEDIGIFWDLPNWDEAKYYYFHTIDFGDNSNNFQANSGVQPTKKDELIEEHYGWRWTEKSHKTVELTFGAATAALVALGYIAL